MSWLFVSVPCLDTVDSLDLDLHPGKLLVVRSLNSWALPPEGLVLGLGWGSCWSVRSVGSTSGLG